MTYYRLRQTDLGGAKAYSPVVKVTGLAAAAESAVVVPNPGSGRFSVVMTDGQELAGTAVVRTLLGTKVMQVARRNDENSAAFDLTNQPAGIYPVQIQTPNGLRTLRVVKQ